MLALPEVSNFDVEGLAGDRWNGDRYCESLLNCANVAAPYTDSNITAEQRTKASGPHYLA
jgi:hypothetical protein